MLRRRRKKDRTTDIPVVPEHGYDIAAVPERWRPQAEAALAQRARFREIAAMAGDGPVAGQLAAIGSRIDDGVSRLWALVEHGATAERAVAVTDPDSIANRLKDARRQAAAAAPGTNPDVEARVDALARSHAAAQRLTNTIEDLGDQLDLIGDRLAAAVAQSAELVVSGATDTAVADVTRELDDALFRLEATRQALAEVDAL